MNTTRNALVPNVFRVASLLLPFCLILLALAATGHARSETLRWQESPQTPVPAAGFKIWAGASYRSYNVSVDVGLAGGADANGIYSITVDLVDPALQSVDLHIALTAYDVQGVHSSYSNELIRSPQAPPTDNGAPNGSIDSPAATTSIAVGESVSFSGSGSDPDGDPVSYAWDFDAVSSGVAPSTSRNPGATTFNRAGNFTVSLTVRDDQGAVDATPATVTVVVASVGEPPPGGSEAGIAGLQRAGSVLGSAVFLTAPAGDPRLFVLDADGLIHIVDGGLARSTPFLDLSHDVSADSDGGLLGLAFDPDYETNGFFYVYRTDASGDSLVSRFTVSSDAYLADPESEEVILTQAQPYSGNNGGTIAFGRDGFLYVGLGDGGSDYDPGERAQNGQSLLGKMLRLDVGVPAAADSIATSGAYAIPADNPFVGDSSVRDEIWALGLRNPYRFSVDRQTGDLWIADQGQRTKEEVNFEAGNDTGGRNYGWDMMEASECNPSDPATSISCDSITLTDPVFEYDQSLENCAIIGGYVYRGVLTDLQGEYFFSDACSGRVWSLDPQTDVVTNRSAQFVDFVSGSPQVVGFGEGGTGELYVIDGAGAVYKIRSENPECSDGFDNDGDGAGDYPQDPGCLSAESTTENPLCNDVFDNDGDGLIDVLDPECTAASQNIEAASIELEDLSAGPLCGLGAELVLIFPPLIRLAQRRRRTRGGQS